MLQVQALSRIDPVKMSEADTEGLGQVCPFHASVTLSHLHQSAVIVDFNHLNIEFVPQPSTTYVVCGSFFASFGMQREVVSPQGK